MLDEPFAGIDPVTVQSIQVVIRELAADGIAILITDHAAREILQITDRTYVVSAGQILISGSAEDIVAHETVRAKYLGEIELDGVSSPQRRTPEPVGGDRQTIRFDEATQESSKIVFSKPRTRKLKRVKAPFRSNDLD